MDCRHIDLVNSPIDFKFFAINRDEDVTISTYDYPFQCSNSHLVLEYYSTSSAGGRTCYNYRLSVSPFFKKSDEYVFLMDYRSARGDNVIVYLKPTKDSRGPILTVYNPRESSTAVIRLGAIIEVIFTDPEQPLSIPSIESGFFELEFLRREIVHDRDDVFRPHKRLFDICRWITQSCQSHFFFQINPKNYGKFLDESISGRVSGPTIKFMNSGQTVNLKVDAYINIPDREIAKESIKNPCNNISTEASLYGLETGIFGSSQIMSRTSQRIVIDRETGYQEIEIPIPEFNINEWPTERFVERSTRCEPFGISVRIQPNGFRVVNRTLLQKFLVISDMVQNKTLHADFSPVGTAEFVCKNEKLTWPIFLGNLQHHKIKKSISQMERKTRIEIGHNTYKRLRVAKVVELKRIDSKQLIVDKVKDKERVIENPEDGETIYLFANESLMIRIIDGKVRWKASSWPLFLISTGWSLSLAGDEFRFKIFSSQQVPSQKLPIIFHGNGLTKKIFVKIID